MKNFASCCTESSSTSTNIEDGAEGSAQGDPPMNSTVFFVEGLPNAAR